MKRKLEPMDGREFLIEKLKHSKNNADFFEAMNT
jgi:transcription termination factor Rho